MNAESQMPGKEKSFLDGYVGGLAGQVLGSEKMVGGLAGSLLGDDVPKYGVLGSQLKEAIHSVFLEDLCDGR